jgi:HAMP domain-containing protein/class 3 adenylate cyclase
MFAILAAAFGGFILVTHLILRALRRLKAGAIAISGGDYSVRVDEGSGDEVGEISEAFNAMAGSVENSIADITAIGDGYSRFVPAQLLDTLGKESIKDVAPGAHTGFCATHMLLSTYGFSENSEEDFFALLNRFYGTVIPSVSGKGGIIDRYTDHGLSAIFHAEPEVALNAIFAMYAGLDNLSEELSTEGRSRIRCNVILTYSEAMLGVVGTDVRLNMIVVSALGYASEKLASLGRISGCRLILAESAFAALGDVVDNYRHRMIGYAGINGTRHPLYDFYFCEDPELRRLKDETHSDFENGVTRYYDGDFDRAKEYFIKVVKRSPNDAMAREYLRQSHLRGESGQPPDELVEI